MAETREGVENIGAILDVPGLDGVFIGPSDLALAYGIDRQAPQNDTRIAQVKSACDAHGVPAGVAAVSVEEARHYVAAGFALVATPSDAVLLNRSCAAFLAGVCSPD